MSSCEDLCLYCSSPQTYKVNFLLIHGVCDDHSSNLQEFLNCQHCLSLLPFTKYSVISKCQSCLQNRALGLLPCGHSLCVDCDATCSICRLGSMNSNKTSPSPSNNPSVTDLNIVKNDSNSKTCDKHSGSSVNPTSEHKLLEESPDTESLVSEPGQIKILTCENCKVAKIKDPLKCGHPVCKNCNIKQCPLCSKVSLYTTESLIDESKKCEYCSRNIFETTCLYNHLLCKSCGSDECPVCKISYGSKKNLCDSCVKSEAVKTCPGEHNVCTQCANNCYICASNSISIEKSLETNRTLNLNSFGAEARTSHSKNCDVCSSGHPVPPCPTCNKRHCQKCSKSHEDECEPHKASPPQKSLTGPSPSPPEDGPKTRYETPKGLNSNFPARPPERNDAGGSQCCCAIY